MKVAGNLAEAVRQMSADVLEDGEGGLALGEDAGDVGPEVSRIVGAQLGAGHAERLARIPSSDEIHDATPRASVEGSDVRPDRSVIHGTLRHSCDQVRAGVCFPLHMSHDTSSPGPKALKGVVDSKLEAAGPGEEAEGAQWVAGTYSHIQTFTSSAWLTSTG